ncbi:hypothetical protein PQX77_012451 [Marasmius sp. AFHP31]|nr:hypothetical protein PQX77_012451 [Marasmius sp. AFHP31]
MSKPRSFPPPTLRTPAPYIDPPSKPHIPVAHYDTIAPSPSIGKYHRSSVSSHVHPDNHEANFSTDASWSAQNTRQHTIGIDGSQVLSKKKKDTLMSAPNKRSTAPSGTKRLKQRFSGLFRRSRRSNSRKKSDGVASADGIIEFDYDDDDFVPGCMPRGLKKTKSFSFTTSTALVNKRVEKKPLQLVKTKLTITVATDSPAARPSTSSSTTDESLPILTPDTPAIQQTQFLYLQSTPRPTNVTPPPVIPSPGFSKDDAHEWYTHLMLQLEQGPLPTPEFIASRLRRYAGHDRSPDSGIASHHGSSTKWSRRLRSRV